MSGPRKPARLGAAGSALWLRLTSLEAPGGAPIVFSPTELVVLELAARQADDLARLETLLAKNGAITTGSKGQPRLSSLPTEIRLQRAALARLIGELALPEFDEQVGLTPVQRKKQRAANVRWANAAKRRREAAGG